MTKTFRNPCKPERVKDHVIIPVHRISGMCFPHKIGIIVQLPLAAEVVDYAAICHKGEIGAIDFLQHYKFHIGAFSTDGCAVFIDLMFARQVNVRAHTAL